MQIDMLAGNTVKITLTPSDMTGYNISYEDISGKSRDTKLMLSKLIAAIREKNQIDLSGERLLVEAFPKNDGGCMLYISCLGSASKQTPSAKTQKPAKTRREYYIAQSDSLDDVAALCITLKKRGANLQSSLYHCAVSGKSVYRLCLCAAKIPPEIKGITAEFMQPLGKSETALCDTEEYFKLLCGDAIATVADSIG